MAQPTAYDPATSFLTFEGQQPAFPGQEIDRELAALQRTTDETLANLALIQRDDGDLANLSVGLDQLKPEVGVFSFNPPTTWATATIYAVRDFVFINSLLYRCLVAHTSGVFATDLAAAKWVFVADFALELPAPVTPQLGGTGIANNAASTITITGSFGLAFTLSASTSLTLPTSGTLATLGGTNTWTANNYFKSGRPWFDVRAFGCVGDGITDDTANFQAAITAAAVVTGCVYVPIGNYYVPGGITLPSNVHLQGANKVGSVIQSILTDVIVVNTTGGDCSMANLAIYGKGATGDTGTFGATQPALQITSSNGFFRDIRVLGGAPAVYITGTDNYLQAVDSGNSYASYNVRSVAGSNWFFRCKFDHSPVGQSVTTSQPYPAWAALTVYVAGNTRLITNGGNVYAAVCTVGGTSGAAAPTLKNYGINITDGSATWQLVAKSVFIGCSLESASLENRFVLCDFSGTGYTASFQTTHNSNAVNFVECVFNTHIDITGCLYCIIRDCAIGGTVTVYAGNTGFVGISDNWWSGAGVISIGANVNNLAINHNYMAGGTITVAPGTSDHYTISDNIRATVTDGGTGTNKSVSVPGAAERKTINATYNLATASGTQDITGFGFNPKAVELSWCVSSAGGGGFGFADSSGSQGCSVLTSDSGTTWIRQTAQAILYTNAAVSATQQGVVSFITDGIRITWAKGGSPTGTLGISVLGHR